MSPRALALCLTPSLFSSTENAETNSRVLELLIEHWSWLSRGLHRTGSQLAFAEGLGHTFSEACLYACRTSILEGMVLVMEIHLISTSGFRAIALLSISAVNAPPPT
ncbi:unnamed protein product [Dibothriocephalus latus]|uniref:Rho-GAP domain-containing protein n=1 Tax=Dibothriocephalus latus TaxID=60516 RepID=A0A3P6R7Q0_DIBLA|nr:unnamed protein product [Dibothriocephalus latus]